MAEDTKFAAPDRTKVRDNGAFLLAAAGLATAFGAASCCALPLLLGSLSLGSAWLIAIAWFATPHRVALLAVAVACLISGGGLLLWRHRRIAACAPGAASGRPATAALTTVALPFGAVLAVLGFLYA